jgi:hypothetical protein
MSKFIERVISVFAFSSVYGGAISAYNSFDSCRTRNFMDHYGNPKEVSSIVMDVSFSAIFGCITGPVILATSPITVPAIMCSYAMGNKPVNNPAPPKRNDDNDY